MKKLLLLSLILPSAIFGGGDKKVTWSDVKVHQLQVGVEDQLKRSKANIIKDQQFEMDARRKNVEQMQNVLWLQYKKDNRIEAKVSEMINDFPGLHEQVARTMTVSGPGALKQAQKEYDAVINGDEFALRRAAELRIKIDILEQQETQEIMKVEYHNALTLQNVANAENRLIQQQVQQSADNKTTNTSWKPFMFRTTLGVGACAGLSYLTYKNKDRIVAGADKMTNGLFSQYFAMAWNKVLAMSKFTFTRPQFSGFGSGINFGFFGNRAQSAFVGARSYVSNLFSNLRR